MFAWKDSKRKDYRVYNPIPLTCEIANAQNNSIVTKTVMAKDISRSGIYFEMDETPPLRIPIKVSFKLPKSDSTIKATVKVARIESTEYENLYGIGAIFENIEEKDRQEIEKFAEHFSLNRLLELTISRGASDLHLLADHPPVLRVHGKIETESGLKFSSDEIEKLLYSIMSRSQIRKFEQEKELDFGIQYDSINRFRVNVHQQKGFTEATLRLINTRVPTIEELNLPEAVKDLSRLKDGLVLITGPTGSGKTTTIAAMVNLINKERQAVIITLERPIEYIYLDEKSIIKQREIGIDTSSFSVALKSSLRQDPNVIVIGELDDIETIRTAMVAAEAGYLVIASFHAPSTMQALDRLAGMFSSEHRKAILSQLANCTRGIISQLLLPRKNQEGRVLACEIVIVNDAVKRIMRNDEISQLPNIIQTGGTYKMQLMADAIKKYLWQDIIDEDTANFYTSESGRYGR
ncbi:PilT/PilU family type 4a pilus ATPase [bacterium]|nr:MAG: PilT/PilU family type 4a pilus ATPase [bacterium]